MSESPTSTTPDRHQRPRPTGKTSTLPVSEDRLRELAVPWFTITGPRWLAGYDDPDSWWRW